MFRSDSLQSSGRIGTSLQESLCQGIGGCFLAVKSEHPIYVLWPNTPLYAMMTPGEKVIAIGMLGLINTVMLAFSAFLAAGTLIATLPFATLVAHQ